MRFINPRQSTTPKVFNKGPSALDEDDPAKFEILQQSLLVFAQRLTPGLALMKRDIRRLHGGFLGTNYRKTNRGSQNQTTIRS